MMQHEKHPRVFLGLGANLGDRAASLHTALLRLNDWGIDVVGHSGLFESPPWGMALQPDYLNAVAELRTRLTPEDLLDVLQDLEQQLGRQRFSRWGPRHIDLDILAYDRLELATPSLVLPHPFAVQRAFVMVPWAQLAPTYRLVGFELSIAELAAQLPPAEREAVRPLVPLATA